jgi:Histidine kinase-, DNA gyrase B-, and HSP90-like ATPase
MPVSPNTAASTSGGLNLPISWSRVLSDTGQGLTPEESSRLFTPYYTTKPHGTGLGLAIVQSVVSDHHGHISVESAPGKGATFRIGLAWPDSTRSVWRSIPSRGQHRSPPARMNLLRSLCDAKGAKGSVPVPISHAPATD